MDERLLTEKLIGYDTSTPQGIKECAGFVKGWLEARDIPTRVLEVRNGLPVTLATVGPEDAPTTLLLHGHIDVVPGREILRDLRMCLVVGCAQVCESFS